MLAQLRFDASPVLRTTRLRKRFQHVPPSDRCRFGCAAADNTIEPPACSPGALQTQRRTSTDATASSQIPANPLAAPSTRPHDIWLPGECHPVLDVGPDRVIEPHVAIHTRPDMWYLNEGHLFVVEVDVAGDTLCRQTEIALAKRATYAPLLAHLRAHSGWTTHLVVLVFGPRGIIHPAALSGLTSVLTALDMPKRQAGKLAKKTLQACSVSCVTDATTILRMRQGHPAHGYVQ